MSIKVSKTEFVDINTIRSNEKNPRYIKDKEFEELVESIKNFPEMLEARPCVVDEDGIILGGNMRHRAAVAAGRTIIPIVRMEGLSEEKKREFIIKDNVNKGSWDWEILANEWAVHELSDWGLEFLKSTEEQEEEQKSGYEENLTWFINVEVLSENDASELHKELTDRGFTVKIIK